LLFDMWYDDYKVMFGRLAPSVCTASSLHVAGCSVSDCRA